MIKPQIVTLGTRTQGSRMIGADESTQIWRYPLFAHFLKTKCQPKPKQEVDGENVCNSGSRKMKKAKASKRERNTFSIEKTKRYLATMQCDQIGLFLKCPGDKLSFTNSPNMLKPFGPYLTTFWANLATFQATLGENVPTFCSFIWPHCFLTRLLSGLLVLFLKFRHTKKTRFNFLYLLTTTNQVPTYLVTIFSEVMWASNRELRQLSFLSRPTPASFCLFLFFFQTQILQKKLQAQARFELGSSEQKASSLTT